MDPRSSYSTHQNGGSNEHDRTCNSRRFPGDPAIASAEQERRQRWDGQEQPTVHGGRFAAPRNGACCGGVPECSRKWNPIRESPVFRAIRHRADLRDGVGQRPAANRIRVKSRWPHGADHDHGGGNPSGRGFIQANRGPSKNGIYFFVPLGRRGIGGAGRLVPGGTSGFTPPFSVVLSLRGVNLPDIFVSFGLFREFKPDFVFGAGEINSWRLVYLTALLVVHDYPP